MNDCEAAVYKWTQSGRICPRGTIEVLQFIIWCRHFWKSDTIKPWHGRHNIFVWITASGAAWVSFFFCIFLQHHPRVNVVTPGFQGQMMNSLSQLSSGRTTDAAHHEKGIWGCLCFIIISYLWPGSKHRTKIMYFLQGSVLALLYFPSLISSHPHHRTSAHLGNWKFGYYIMHFAYCKS